MSQPKPAALTMELPWPAVFSESIDAPYHPNMRERERIGCAIADQLMAWGNCHMAAPRPKSFEAVMVKLSKMTGAATAEECHAAARKWRAGS